MISYYSIARHPLPSVAYYRPFRKVSGWKEEQTARLLSLHRFPYCSQGNKIKYILSVPERSKGDGGI